MNFIQIILLIFMEKMGLFRITGIVAAVIIGLTDGSPAGMDTCSQCENMIVSVNSMVDEQTRNQILDTICEAYSVESRDKCTELSRLSPSKLCQQFGQCKSTSLKFDPRSDFVLEPHTTDVSSLPCIICENAMKIAEDFLKSKEHQKFLLNALKSVCHMIPFFKQQCLFLVDSYGPLLVQLAVHFLTPESCKMFHICPGVQVEAIQDECTLCRYGVGIIYDTVQDPALETRIQDLAEDICENYVDDISECVTSAHDLTQRLLPIVTELRHSDSFKHICERTDICSAEENVDVMID
ncbi:uncharacterized protein LOC132757841 [Ruditapes philippinarum]|uniref:uncharacterized protein LOC132757841 n=1 Tax=Ruditapes philippinarum TaxID=129788 RepID=UPI00295AF481|nr:uncharacterized protein LOC132757841 [Ruditapes philippinarum]